MRQPSKHRSFLAFASAVCATLMSSAVSAAIDVPRVPLQSGTAVPPNIMFILDDSGSMEDTSLPDNVPAVQLQLPAV